MENLFVSPSPHIRAKNTTRSIMLDVIIALVPALIAGTVLLGIRSLAVTAVSVVSCVFFEWACRKLMKRSNTIGDLSAVVTGLLLAMNLPVNFPLWMTVIGAFIAIVLVKQMFGGIGQNFANPAIAARVVLLVGFTTQMTSWEAPVFSSNPDAIAGATPLVDLSKYSVSELFFGNVGGCLRNLCFGTNYRWRLFDHPPCDQSSYPFGVHRNRICILLLVRGRPSKADFRRGLNVGGVLYGNRLCYLANYHKREDHFCFGLWRNDSVDSAVRQLSRRGFLRNFNYEYGCAIY